MVNVSPRRDVGEDESPWTIHIMQFSSMGLNNIQILTTDAFRVCGPLQDQISHFTRIHMIFNLGLKK